ncbi:sigma-54-dependent transcriptional regulator [Candidatus Contendibacter odensensis]|uniref:Two component sigma-54-dependent hydrogenase transcriptional regulator, Fis family n=1 Tax=Candidatus Contendobacter odensis Run_B_J11 TaxID=1400861 RepID=A0A7U7GBY6_9GAMM|nr:sigma-54 dependent transcriptional regulator [Candidatus Contendobacter odensis]CDH45356.1 Two component sigma-54-dependent hydrogenase transcriptional regulator, Fis family [Candidatus Contendobacter odensis Run_B_J11]
MNHHALLIVDDEKEILRSLTLTFEGDYEVFTASSASAALEILQQQNIALVIADQRMPEMTGAELFAKTVQTNPHSIRIILTGYTDTASLVQAINQGHIYQYITKPWDRQELRIIVKRALEKYELSLTNQRLLKELEATNDRLSNENEFLKREISKELQGAEIIGKSAIMQRVCEVVNKIIDHSVTVMLTGETGTGKTLLARYIHQQGPRKNKLFVEQNCGTLPEELLESELFGHKRGAFTGAIQDRKGLFEVADGGTLFLDEISEMSPALQVKLLQVLQEGQFRRVGENEYRQVDVRIIAATNKDLMAAIKKDQFRADLYYRLNVFPIDIPPLRERIEDISLLADHCLNKRRHKLKHPVTGFSEDALQTLYQYDYPGNVRELENLIDRAVILNDGAQIEAGEWLPRLPVNINNLSRVEQFEKIEIKRLVELYQGDLDQVAKELKMSRSTLWRRMRSYLLDSNPVVAVSK